MGRIFFNKTYGKKYYRYGVVLGIIFGIGFFIKSSVLVFLISFFVSAVYLIKTSSKKGKTLEIIGLTILMFFSVILLLVINPEFWSTLASNSRFTFTVKELISFPIGTWINSIGTNLRILFFYFTPVVFILSVIGILKIFSNSSKHKIFLLFFLVSFIIETFTIKGATDRYIVSFSPFLVICASFALVYFINKKQIFGYLILIFSLAIPLVLTLYQITNFPNYILNMGKISGYINNSYLTTNTSGYGVNEAIDYFKNLSKKEELVIGIAQNTGNPESAFQVYFNKTENPRVVYIDSSLLTVNLNDYDCLSTGVNTYFVSRDNQQAGLEKFLIKLETFKNPYGTNTIGVHKLNQDCKGKTIKVSITKTSK